jgi:DNA (cytosine-5)-methyltransferase 1
MADSIREQTHIELQKPARHDRQSRKPVAAGKETLRQTPWPAGHDVSNRLSAILRKADECALGELVDGVSARVGKLRAYGNAIVPQVAAEFVRAYLETRA